MQIIECPQCGASASPAEHKCSYCKAEFFVTSIAYLSGFDKNGLNKYVAHFKKQASEHPNGGEGWLGLGLCYLQTGLFPMAQKSFEKAIQVAPELPQPYYYFALSKISGRRLMSLPLNEIREVENYANTALQLESESALYKLLLALIKSDYYEENGLMVNAPTMPDILAEIDGVPVNKNEIERLRQCVLVEDESYLEEITIN